MTPPYTLQQQVAPRRELNKGDSNQSIYTNHDFDTQVRIDELDFSGKHNTDAFLDWKHRMMSDFRCYDMPEERKF